MLSIRSSIVESMSIRYLSKLSPVTCFLCAWRLCALAGDCGSFLSFLPSICPCRFLGTNPDATEGGGGGLLGGIVAIGGGGGGGWEGATGGGGGGGGE